MAKYQDVHVQMENLGIDDEENEAFVFEEGVEEESNKYELCLVGRFLTEKSINVRAMKSKLADIWRPAMGINIKEIESGVFLFQFYHREDVQWVVKGGPWSFDNAMLIIKEITTGEEPLKVPLWSLNFWIQIYDLPTGFMTEAVGRQLGNFFGQYLEYDQKNNEGIWREYMRLKISLDVRKPLKRKKKITRRNGTEFMVTCKYERLGEFCFSCGLVSHTERFCRRSLDKRGDEASKEWGNWLRAPPRRAAGQSKSKWLREEGDADWEERIGRDNSIPRFGGEVGNYGGKEICLRRDIRQPNFSISENPVFSNVGAQANNFVGLNFNLEKVIGPEADELSGLNVEERKRRRGGPDSFETMDTEGRLQMVVSGKQVNTIIGASLSGLDCAAPSTSDSAQLARQASRPQ